MLALVCVCTATIENETPLRHNTSTRIFTRRGYIWSMKSLDLDYLAPNQFSKMTEGSGDFASACVEFRFHLGHPYCLPCVCAYACVASENQALRMNENSGFFQSSVRASNTRKKPRP